MRRVWAVLAAVALASTAVIVVAVPAESADYYGSGYRNKCWHTEVSWPVQDGSPNINVGKITAFGRVCVGSRGRIDHSNTFLTLSTYETDTGEFWHYDFYKRGQYVVVSTVTKETTRLFGAYKWCIKKWSYPLCTTSFNGHPGFFTIDIGFYQWGGAGTRPPLVRQAFFNNQNAYSDLRWS